MQIRVVDLTLLKQVYSKGVSLHCLTKKQSEVADEWSH